MRVKLNTAFLKAALMCAVKPKSKDARTNLKSVCLDFIQPEQVVIVATDGLCLFAGKQDIEYSELPLNSFCYQVLVPYSTLELALKGAGSVVVLAKNGQQYCINDINFMPIDGMFPAYTRVVPTAVSNDAAQFDPALLDQMNSALQVASNNKAPSALFRNGYGAAVMQNSNTECIGVVMPYEHKGDNAHIAEFRGWRPVAKPWHPR